MGEITKCNGLGCELKSLCLRFKAKTEDLWQPYFKIAPYQNTGEDQSCKYLIERNDDE